MSRGQTQCLTLCSKLGEKQHTPRHTAHPALTQAPTGKSLLVKNHGLDCLELQHNASTLKPSRISVKQKKAKEEEKVDKT